MQYTAVVENSNKQRSTLTLDISGHNPHGAFDWCCEGKGLKRVGRIKKQTSGPAELFEFPVRKFPSCSESIQKTG